MTKRLRTIVLAVGLAASTAAANAQQPAPQQPAPQQPPQQQRAPGQQPQQQPQRPAQQRPPAAGTQAPKDDFGRLLEEQARALKGWPGGIAFQCLTTPAELHTEQHRQLCTDASATASAQATRAKIRFGQAPDFRGFVTMLVREQALGLTVQISTSDFRAPVASMVIRIYASRSYSDVVSAGALRRGANAPPSPLATPRAGDVVFWEEQVVGSGPPDQLVAGLKPAIENKLKQLFAIMTSR